MKTFLIIVAACTVLISLFLILSNMKSDSTSTFMDDKTVSVGEETNTYRSELFEFEIEIPEHMTVEEKFTVINILDNENQLSITRNGTEFDRLGDHVDNLDRLNGVTGINKKEFTTDGFESLSRNIETPEGQAYYSYSIKIGNWIYGFSTSSPELYDELDQIAQSFRYLGDE